MRFAYTHHSVSLVGRAARAATLLRAADPARLAPLREERRRRGCRASARLDASPLSEETADRVDQRLAEGLPPSDSAARYVTTSAGWASALKLDGLATQDIAAVEYANLLRAWDADDETGRGLREEPLEALRHLHGLLCEGLVEPRHLGAVRRTPRAVHDGAQGKVLYRAPEAEELPKLLTALDHFMLVEAAAMPGLIVASVLHERLLQWQPFEAGNGRLARAAARALRRATGHEPHGLAAADVRDAADPTRYHLEVAATRRRRDDLTLWLERDLDVVVAGLEEAVRAVDGSVAAGALPEGLARLGVRFTVREYAEAQQITLPRAHDELRDLAAVGVLDAEPGGRGLRYRRVEA